jgi:two-component system, OmpR family, response regulator VicR
MMMEGKVLTTYGIAKYCHVTPRTANQWINEGKLKAYRTPGKHSRVQVEDFLEFLKKYGIPVPKEFLPLQHDGKKRILIVDDDKGVVDSIQRFLIREKVYQLEMAFDGFEAGQKFADFKPDLVILDIRMPGLDGYQLCSRIRANKDNNNVRILIISGTIDDKEVKRIIDAGGDDYLSKPFSTRLLKEKIEVLLNKDG